MRIRIQTTKINADPDPKHRLKTKAPSPFGTYIRKRENLPKGDPANNEDNDTRHILGLRILLVLVPLSEPSAITQAV
jgi:hypothetical protein